jgi:uncharacterized membrane protein
MDGKINTAFDKFWSEFDKLWKQVDKVFDEELPENTKVHTRIRISLTKKQLMSLLLGRHKSLLFKVRDDIAIQVEVKP